jgi:hypothetical protein
MKFLVALVSFDAGAGFVAPLTAGSSMAAPHAQKVEDFLDKLCGPRKMGIGNENDQVSKGHLVDALACTGDEGRDTLR